jgi:hypothetical protein
MGWFSKAESTKDILHSSDPTNPYVVEDEEGEWITISHKKAEDEEKIVSSEETEDASTND